MLAKGPARSGGRGPAIRRRAYVQALALRSSGYQGWAVDCHTREDANTSTASTVVFDSVAIA